MQQTSNQLRDYLAADERLAAVYSATLSENSPWVPVSIGVTDRRLLCLSDEGTVVNLGHDAICAVRSRPRSTSTYQGNDYRLLMGVGGLVAVLGVAGVVALASSMLVPLLLPALVGGLASIEYQRRTSGGIDWSGLAGIVDRSGDADDSSGSWTENRDLDAIDDRQVLLLGNGLIAAVSFVGIVALSSSLLVVFLTLSTIGGVAVMDYAYRHRTDFDGIEIERRVEREVSIRTNDGGTIRLRCDPSSEIDRELSRLAFVDRDAYVPTVSARSKSAAGAGSSEG